MRTPTLSEKRRQNRFPGRRQSGHPSPARNNRTAGKSKSSHIKKANKFLLASLVEAAWGATRKKDSASQRRFYRWLWKLGKKKAVIAICHHQLKAVWSVLKSGVTPPTT
jgi:hypothetical protein